MKIEVTQDHIDRGVSTCNRCPVALALIDAGFKTPYVSANTIAAIVSDGTLGWADTPKKAMGFINRFDNDMSVKPFTFEIEL